MPVGRDDDALSWDGDDDPTLDVGAGSDDEGRRARQPESDDQPESARPPETDDAEPTATAGLPEGWSAVGKGSETVAAEPESTSAETAGTESPAAPDAAEHAPMGNAELISLGVLGGFALLYAVGWLIGGLRLQGTAQFLVAPVAYQVSLWLAVIAPLVWFVTVYLLTKGSRAWVRFAWLAAGVLLLVPWPFIMVGAIGR